MRKPMIAARGRMLASLARGSAVAGALVFGAGAAHGEERPHAPNDGDGRGSHWSLDLEAGAEYDTNVSVNEIDLTTREGDGAAVLRASLKYRLEPYDGAELWAKYGFSQSLHFEFDDFDVQAHTAALGAEQEAGPVDLGVDYSYSFATLGGDDFLAMHRIGPYAQLRPADRALVRLVYVYTSKDIDVSPTRDADANAVGADVYYFLDGAKRYVLVGYRYEENDAVGPAFDFTENAPRVRFVSSVADGLARIALGYRYEGRAYDAVTPSIGVARDDDRHRMDAELEAPLGRRLSAVAGVKFNDYRSNLPSADYQETIAGLRLASRF